MANILRLCVGDTLELKKPHPCGGKSFSVLRVGSDVRIRCQNCGHDMCIDRIKLERAVRRRIPSETETVQGES